MSDGKVELPIIAFFGFCIFLLFWGFRKPREAVGSLEFARLIRQCSLDTECKGERVCDSGVCMSSRESDAMSERRLRTVKPICCSK